MTSRTLEGQFDRELHLPRRRGLLELAERRKRRRRIRSCPKDVVHFGKVASVESIEYLEHRLQFHALIQGEGAAEAEIDRCLGGHGAAITPDTRIRIRWNGTSAIRWEGSAISISIEITTRKNVERASGADGDEGCHIKGPGQLIAPAEGEAVALIVERESPLLRGIEPDR